MAGEDNSSIERLKKKLYSRNEEGLGVFKRRRLHDNPNDVGGDWAPPPQDMPRRKRSKHSPLSILLIIAAVFFIGSVSLAGFFFFRGQTTVSSSNIDIEIQGPATIGGGEELTLQIAITNRNATAIESGDLLIEYPEGTRSANDLSVDFPRHRESVGEIRSGERVEKTVKAVLFGEEGSDASIGVTLEYRVPDSNAIFYKEQSYELVLSSAPLAITVDAVEEITSEQEATFVVTVLSNSDSVIEDALLSADYPFGFTFSEADPRPRFTNSVWELGDIEPEGKRTITLKGQVVGENEEERVFRFSTGIRSKVDETRLETAFVTKLHAMVIQKPFIGVELALDGNSASEYVAKGGSRVRGDIRYFNNLPLPVHGAAIEVKISGDMLDEGTVVAQNGFYRSSDNTILYSGETNNALRTLDEGDSGNVAFSFETYGLDAGKTFRNPEITIEVTISGRRSAESNVSEAIESTIVRSIKVASDLLLTSRAVYSTGPFTNTGPLPPEAEKETTYTILWTVTNSHNSVSGAQVRATLPSYMRFVGAVSPQNANLTFNDIGGEIMWNVGNVAPGGKHDLAFQVELSPSISQVGTTPVLVNEQRLTGVDNFTRTSVGSTQSPLTTRLSTDPGVPSGHDRVEQ